MSECLAAVDRLPRSGNTVGMSGYQQQQQTHQYVGGGQVQLESGLPKFMAGVYGWMAAGIGVTAGVALFASQSQQFLSMMYGPMGLTGIGYVILFAPLVLCFILPNRIPTMSPGGAVALFMVFASMIGLSLAYVPLIYSGSSILQILLATVGMFGGMAALGFVTKKDLTGVGQFLLMALMGAIIASIIGMLFNTGSMMSMLISAIVAVVSAGLTAYHTQAIKQLYLTQGGRGNLAIVGALALYINFLNLFLSLLRLFGGRD